MVARRLIAMVIEDVATWLVELAEVIDPPKPLPKRVSRPKIVAKPAWYDDGKDYPR